MRMGIPRLRPDCTTQANTSRTLLRRRVRSDQEEEAMALGAAPHRYATLCSLSTLMRKSAATLTVSREGSMRRLGQDKYRGSLRSKDVWT
ncbi:hypothetical protein AMTR_s00170p00056030 [Amborella trichopoda]|uniref:Uncharacterized protein n=1 Tax=Amborella trichopoda TaxID=13333 RepID=W1NR92_AMBTC|nr:hypothetical protein AMTR_s00170p00056030 [Amborella trichopoda]